MLDLKTVRALGQILETGWGKQSSPSGHVSIISSLENELLTLKFNTIVHFASERSLRDQTMLLDDESMQRVKGHVSNIKKQFKEMTGEPLKLKEVSNRDELELISATSNSPRKIAYYRRFVSFQVSV